MDPFDDEDVEDDFSSFGQVANMSSSAAIDVGDVNDDDDDDDDFSDFAVPARPSVDTSIIGEIDDDEDDDDFSEFAVPASKSAAIMEDWNVSPKGGDVPIDSQNSERLSQAQPVEHDVGDKNGSGQDDCCTANKDATSQVEGDAVEPAKDTCIAPVTMDDTPDAPDSDATVVSQAVANVVADSNSVTDEVGTADQGEEASDGIGAPDDQENDSPDSRDKDATDGGDEGSQHEDIFGESCEADDISASTSAMPSLSYPGKPTGSGDDDEFGNFASLQDPGADDANDDEFGDFGDSNDAFGDENNAFAESGGSGASSSNVSKHGRGEEEVQMNLLIPASAFQASSTLKATAHKALRETMKSALGNETTLQGLSQLLNETSSSFDSTCLNIAIGAGHPSWQGSIFENGLLASLGVVDDREAVGALQPLGVGHVAFTGSPTPPGGHPMSSPNSAVAAPGENVHLVNEWLNRLPTLSFLLSSQLERPGLAF